MLAVLLIPSTVIYAADVSDALYSATIRAVNTSYTAQRVAVPFTLSTDALIDGYYINSDVNNIAIQDSIGNDIVFMPAPPSADDFVMYIPQISQNASVNYSLYAGGPDMSPAIAYFPASTGMTTTDDASLEPGDDFEIIIDGFIDTSAGADKYLVDKDGDLSLYVSGESEITASIVGEPIGYPEIEGYATYYNPSNTIHTVTLPASEAGDYLIIFMAADRTPTLPAGWASLASGDNYDANHQIWYKVAEGTEGLSVTATFTSGTRAVCTSYCVSGADGIEASSSATGNDDNPNSASLSPSWGEGNYLWFSSGTQEGAGEVDVYPTNYGDSSEYGAGIYYYVFAAARTLNATSENPGEYDTDTSDYWIAFTTCLYSAPPAITLTASDISSGEHEVKVSANGTNLYLYVDDVLEDSAALDGAIIVDNPADWEYCLNGSVIYLNSLEAYVSSVLVQQIEWEYDTTFSDGSGNGNDATPTFRTTSTDADVSASLLNFGVISESELVDDGDSGTVPMITVAPDEPPQAYGDMDVTFPGAAVINNLLEAGRFPQELFWYPLLFGLSAAFGMVAFHFTRSILYQSLISGTGVAISTLAILQADFWVLIPYVIVSLALITSRKTVSL